jgi:hypothetical protein
MALHYAALRNHLEVVAVLCDRGAKVNAVDEVCHNLLI